MIIQAAAQAVQQVADPLGDATTHLILLCMGGFVGISKALEYLQAFGIVPRFPNRRGRTAQEQLILEEIRDGIRDLVSDLKEERLARRLHVGMP